MNSFRDLLRDLVARTPGATAAIFADWEGEPVDQYGEGPKIDIQLIGAHCGLLLQQVAASCTRAALGEISELVVEAESSMLFVRRVTPEYYVVLETRSETHLGRVLVELGRTSELLRREM